MEVRPRPVRAGARQGAAAIAVEDRRLVAPPAAPFRGIQPFRSLDRAVFFAREAETSELVDLVTVYRGVMLYGDSGTGKSSLVNAGLIPEATELGMHAERLRVQPRRGEELVLERIPTRDDGAALMPSLLVDDGDDAPRAVFSAAAFEQRVQAACEHGRPLLVFDQFEELVTLFDEADAREARERVIELLVELIHGSLPVKVLLVFREDYLGRVKQLLADCPDLVDQALRLAPPEREALGTIIRGPFERNPGRFAHELSPALAERLRGALGERFGSGDVSLSEVQTVCLRLWQVEDPEALLEQRGIQGLLEDYLGEALDAFPPDVRRAAVALLAQMVTSAGTRNVISAEDLADRVRAEEDLPRPLLERALARLEGESRLVRRERRRDLYLYELTSEFLVPWISDQREQQRRQQERRRLLILSALTGAGLLIAVIVGALALWAFSQRNHARNAATSATALGLSVAAQNQLGNRLDVALLLALDAYETSPRFTTWSSLVGAIEAARASGAVAVMHGHDDFVRSVAFSPDGRTVASGGNDGTVRLWDRVTHRQVGMLASARPTAIASIDFSPDGRLLATGGAGGVVRLWNVARRRLDGHQLPPQPSDVSSVAFSPGGHMLASAGSDGSLRLWAVTARQPIGRPFGGVPHGIASIAWSPDSRLLASGGGDATVRLWDVVGEREAGAPLIGHRQSVGSVAFSPDGRTLAAGGTDGTVLLWDVATFRRRGGALVGHTGAVTSIAFAPDGRTLAAGSEDDTVRLWRVATGRQIGSALVGHTQAVTGVAFSRDGRTLASSGYDGTVRLWDLVAHRQIGQPLETEAVGLSSVALGADGRTVVAGGLDGSVYVWSNVFWHSSATLRSVVCSLVGSDLSRAEWRRYAPDLAYQRHCTSG